MGESCDFYFYFENFSSGIGEQEDYDEHTSFYISFFLKDESRESDNLISCPKIANSMEVYLSN